MPGGHICWELLGPALQQWTKLEKDIDKYFRCCDPLPSTVFWPCYMVGKSQEFAQPTVIFCSPDKRSRKKARDFLLCGGVLENYPGFKTADSARVPGAENLIPLGLNDHDDTDDINSRRLDRPSIKLDEQLMRDVSFWKSKSSGRYIVLRSSDHGSSWGTIACHVTLHDKSYFLTAAHIFTRRPPFCEWTDAGTDSDFSIDGDDEDEDTNYSIGSLSQGSEPSSSSTSGDWVLLNAGNSTGQPFSPVSSGVPDLNDYVKMDWPSTVSIKWLPARLDCCLIRVPHSFTLDFPLDCPIGLHIQCPSQPRAQTGRYVQLITSRWKTEICRLSLNSASIRLPSQRESQELWSIRSINGFCHMKPPLQPGDCGSLVLDRNTASLYGFVVAGDPSIGTVYIIPAYQVIENIRERFGGPIIINGRNVVTATALADAFQPIANISAPDRMLHSVSESQQESSGLFKCICDYDDDSQDEVLCETCGTWQHVRCYYADLDVPDIHECSDCSFKQRDTEKGIEHQQQRDKSQNNKKNWQQAASAALIAGATEAYRARKDPEKGTRIATAALASAGLDSFGEMERLSQKIMPIISEKLPPPPPSNWEQEQQEKQGSERHHQTISATGKALSLDDRTGLRLSSKPHKCPYCDSEFTRHHNLKSHLLTHSQEKSYECPTCHNVRFGRLQELRRHTRTHTGEKPHTCRKCGRDFARGDVLARHKKGVDRCAGRSSSEAIEGDDSEGMKGLEYSGLVEELELMEEDGVMDSSPLLTSHEQWPSENETNMSPVSAPAMPPNRFPNDNSLLSPLDRSFFPSYETIMSAPTASSPTAPSPSYRSDLETLLPTISEFVAPYVPYGTTGRNQASIQPTTPIGVKAESSTPIGVSEAVPPYVPYTSSEWEPAHDAATRNQTAQIAPQPHGVEKDLSPDKFFRQPETDTDPFHLKKSQEFERHQAEARQRKQEKADATEAERLNMQIDAEEKLRARRETEFDKETEQLRKKYARDEATEQYLHHSSPGGPFPHSVNPDAAPASTPATTPLIVRQDQNGVQWIAFEYSRDRVRMAYTVRCDVVTVDIEAFSQDFKSENCIYPRACVPKEQYKGNRFYYETECNIVGWALAELNPCLRGKRGLIQRAVDSWSNSNQDFLESRRDRGIVKANNSKVAQMSESTDHHGPQLTGPIPSPDPFTQASGSMPMESGPNPPCNTIYVGHLPLNASEEELKAAFSDQPGYKRLCFRTKDNGPMCFVEFEDVSFATRALSNLDGHPLSGSMIGGGITLSYAKNPLDVRTSPAGPSGSGMGDPRDCRIVPTLALEGIRDGRRLSGQRCPQCLVNGVNIWVETGRNCTQCGSSTSGNRATMAPAAQSTGTSRGSASSNGRSVRTQQISAPVMAENSLGWN